MMMMDRSYLRTLSHRELIELAGTNSELAIVLAERLKEAGEVLVLAERIFEARNNTPVYGDNA